jgi:nucleoside-diphosphate-sugar epimerase
VDLQFDKVAVTGGSGRLGGYVLERLVGHCEAKVIDLRPPERDVAYEEVSVTDHAALVSAFRGQEAVVHLAAIPNPRVTTQEDTFVTNVHGTWAVLDAAEQAGVRRVVIASSDSATGLHYNLPGWEPQYLPIDEDHPLKPMEAYSLSKQVTETVARSYAARGKLEVLAIRPTHIVFAPEHPELEERGSDIDNYHLWSYVEPGDVAEAFALTLGLERARFELFFVSAADTLSRRPTLELIEERYGAVPEIRDPELYEGNPCAAVWDIKRARTVLGYEPRSDWRKLWAARGD